MTRVIVSGEKGGSVMYGEDDERGKSTVWQGDGARLLAALLCFSGKLQKPTYVSAHTFAEHIYVCAVLIEDELNGRSPRTFKRQ